MSKHDLELNSNAMLGKPLISSHLKLQTTFYMYIFIVLILLYSVFLDLSILKF